MWGCPKGSRKVGLENAGGRVAPGRGVRLDKQVHSCQQVAKSDWSSEEHRGKRIFSFVVIMELENPGYRPSVLLFKPVVAGKHLEAH